MCINKPQGPSSFQMVARLRSVLGVNKIGHAGTLDPDASGLLVVAIGSATRLIQYLPNEPKVYRFGLQFGSQTDTLDSKGKVVSSGGSLPSPDDLAEVLGRYSGDYLQMPPDFSAKKINGVRAYKFARNGVTPVLEARWVKIYSLDLIRYDHNSGLAEFQLCCSGGTYVRALVRDLAKDLQTFGFASYIRRTGSGNFSVDQALDIDDIKHAANYIMSAAEVLNKELSIQLCEDQQAKIVHGQDILLPQKSDFCNKPVFAYCGTHLLAVLQCKENSLFHPVAVFPLPGKQS